MEELTKMDDFKSEIEASFKTVKEGDILKGTIIGVGESGLNVDLGIQFDGFIPSDEISNNPRTAIRSFHVGDEVTAVVIDNDNEETIRLSIKQATQMLAWDSLNELMEKRTIVKVRVQAAVRGGVTTYLNDIRAFIPASMLSLTFVEDLESYVRKELNVIVTTVDKDTHKLILSAREVERERLEQEKNLRISALQKGLVIKGKVEKIMPYGAFITMEDGLSGLVHISQICGKRIKSPNEVLKLDQEVTAKIIDVKEGKISLSIKAVEEENETEIVEDLAEVPMSYSDGGSATTGLGDLLKNFKF